MTVKIKKIIAIVCSVILIFTCANSFFASELENADFKVVDLSHWNNKVDWNKLSASVDGVILKIGYRGSVYHSALKEDELFYQYYNEAVKHSIPVGCYFYTYSYNVADAVEEANWTINLLKKYNCRLDMPIYFDFEAEQLQTKLTTRQRTDIAKAFCKTLTDNGFYAGIYANRYWATSLLYMSELSQYTLWLAQYNSTVTYAGTYDMWQYTDSGSVSGVTGKVDISRCYRNFPKYIRENGYNMFSGSPALPTEEPTAYSKDCGTYKTKSSVSVRAKAGSSFGSIGTLPASAEVYVYETGSSWGKIHFGTESGYIKLDSSVQKTSDYISTDPQIGLYEVNTQNLNVRTGPSTAYTKDGQVHSGDKLFINKVSANWGSFNYGSGKTGWISLDYADMNVTISFSTGIAGKALAPQQAKSGQNITLAKSGLSVPGYNFDGWSDIPGGKVIYSDSSSLKAGSSNITLYAVFSEIVKADIAFKAGANLDSGTNIVAVNDKKLSEDQFLDKYIALSGGATVSFTNTVSSRIGTGSIITADLDGVKKEYTIAVKGDTNSDGICDALDLSDILAYTQGAKQAAGFSAAQLNAMDVTGDKIIDSKDVEKIKNAAFGLAVL